MELEEHLQSGGLGGLPRRMIPKTLETTLVRSAKQESSMYSQSSGIAAISFSKLGYSVSTYDSQLDGYQYYYKSTTHVFDETNNLRLISHQDAVPYSISLYSNESGKRILLSVLGSGGSGSTLNVAMHDVETGVVNQNVIYATSIVKLESTNNGNEFIGIFNISSRKFAVQKYAAVGSSPVFGRTYTFPTDINIHSAVVDTAGNVYVMYRTGNNYEYLIIAKLSSNDLSFVWKTEIYFYRLLR